MVLKATHFRASLGLTMNSATTSSAPRRDGADLPNAGRRAEKNSWRLALLAAFALHGALVLCSGEGVKPLIAPKVVEQALELEVFEVEDEALPEHEPGGGSSKAGLAELATPVAALAPPLVAKKVAPKTPKEPKPAQELVHPRVTTEPESQEVNETDPLLADAFDELAAFTLPKPKAARTMLERKPEVLQRDVEPTTIAKDKQPQDNGSTHVGSGRGRRGGPGGAGSGNGRVVKEKFAFGGPEGAFQADVCALPKGTASIGLIADCPHLLTFFADRINVAQRHFREGFPGIEDRVEWFGIKYTGQFRTEAAGVYEFRLSSDDGSRLLIDEQLVINNDGTHAPLSRSGRIHLAAGLHQLKLLYFQGPGTLLALQLFVTPPGRREKTFRPEF